MTTLDLLGTSPAPKPRKLTQYVPWLIAFAAIIYVFRSIEEHPECIPTIPHPLSHATEQSSISSHLSYHNKGFGRWSSYESWFFFGDSYTATNFDENGEQPRPGHPLGNHGKDAMLQNWPLYVTSRYNASFIKSYNFAKGGSTVDRGQVKPYMLGSSFVEEAKVFIDNYVTPPRKADWNPETSLFSMWFGVNDLVLPHWTGNDQGSLPAIFASYTETTVKLYNAGARNFIFLTVPPAYRSIELDAGGLLSVAEDMASFNSRIFEMRSNLQTNFPKAHFAVFDAHSFWARVIESPSDFAETKHVKNSTSVCSDVKDKTKIKANQICEDGVPLREHIWTNLHGTSTIHNATAARVVQDCLGPSGKRGFCF